jgi:hypothetical protein
MHLRFLRHQVNFCAIKDFGINELLFSTLQLYNAWLRTSGEEIAFSTLPKIHSHSQIFRYGQSIFCLPYRPKFSDFFDLCLHWVSVVHFNFFRLTFLQSYIGTIESMYYAFMYKETYLIPPWETILSNCLTHQLNSGQTTVTKEFFGQGHCTMEPKTFLAGND